MYYRHSRLTELPWVFNQSLHETVFKWTSFEHSRCKSKRSNELTIWLSEVQNFEHLNSHRAPCELKNNVWSTLTNHNFAVPTPNAMSPSAVLPSPSGPLYFYCHFDRCLKLVLSFTCIMAFFLIYTRNGDSMIYHKSALSWAGESGAWTWDVYWCYYH